ncbi:MAG TPA: EAL domain-containing protein [Gammaproteobacteria bacterium]|nr:EAL domain-containing protein [Gammaproteobacteria bacterium]
MAGKKNDDGRVHGTERALGKTRRFDPRAQFKELDYVLQVLDEDRALLARYQDVLAQGAAGFAEVYYNYLFDNPATAERLYAFERGGGDVGELIRAQLQHLLHILSGATDDKAAERLAQVGTLHYNHNIEPAWVLGAYRLYLEHLQQLISAYPGIEAADREPLRLAVLKVVFRDLGMMLQGHSAAAVSALGREREQAAVDRDVISNLLANIPQMVWSVDVQTQTLLYVSPAIDRICRDRVQAPVPCMEHIHPDDQERVGSVWEQAVHGIPSEADCRMQLAGDAARWFRLALYPFKKGRRILRVDGLMEDVTDAREVSARLQQLATTDELTDLANRTLWYDRLQQALAACRRAGTQVALMLLDLDHFKMVNDTLGHAAGDVLLRQVGSRLRTVLRDSDTLARLGGDEFAVLLSVSTDAVGAAEQVAQKIVGCFRAPFWFEGRELYLATAIGIALYPEHGEDAESLLGRADMAMYRAKRSEAPFLFYEPGSEAPVTEQLQLSGQLRHALERNEFELYYQPKVDIRSARICGAEALLRWKHPQEGLVAPQRFLHIAERIGLMTPITDWVLVTALRQSRDLSTGGVKMPIAVNVSARSFQSPRLLQRIRWALDEAAVDGDCLEIEITEETLMADLAHGAEIVAELSELGVGIAIDDFGTGYSSLTYLKRLPIHTLKIDKSFLQDMARNENDAVIVRSIIDLGHNLGFDVVAEGVESSEVWQLLAELGCDAVQGFHISRPLAEPGFHRWLADTPWASGA